MFNRKVKNEDDFRDKVVFPILGLTDTKVWRTEVSNFYPGFSDLLYEAIKRYPDKSVQAIRGFIELKFVNKKHISSDNVVYISDRLYPHSQKTFIGKRGDIGGYAWLLVGMANKNMFLFNHREAVKVGRMTYGEMQMAATRFWRDWSLAEPMEFKLALCEKH